MSRFIVTYFNKKRKKSKRNNIKYLISINSSNLAFYFTISILSLERHEIFDRGQDTGLKLDRTWPLEKLIKQVHALIRRIFASFYGLASIVLC